MVYEIPAKRKQPPHKYPDLGFGPFSDPDLLPTRYSDQVVNTNIPENQPPSQPKYSTYDLSEVEKKMVDNFRQQRGQSDQGVYRDSTLYSRNKGGQGGRGGQGGQGGPRWQGGQGGQGEQLGPSRYSRAPTRDTVDISEYDQTPDAIMNHPVHGPVQLGLGG